jgi:hypothetical protein
LLGKSVPVRAWLALYLEALHKDNEMLYLSFAGTAQYFSLSVRTAVLHW